MNALARSGGMGMADTTRVATHAMQILDATQMLPAKRDQIHALSVLYALLLAELGLDTREELARVERMLRTPDAKMRPEFEAVRDYIKGELK